MRHIFLTGEIQVGKSTVVQKALSGLNITLGGFRSGSGDERYEASRHLYLWDVTEPPICDEFHCVALLSREKGCLPYPDRFDALGCAALRRAKETCADLILMDECGFLERDAAEFQAEVLRTLDGDIPVFGVVRLRENSWTESIRSHPNVTLVTVTEENRDALPEQIVSLLKQNL